jgi:hypothetical protein
MKKLIGCVQVVIMGLILMPAYATYLPKTAKQSNLSKVAYAAKHILQDIGLVFGIGMVLAGLYKYSDHRANPLAHPLGRVVTLIVAGAALIGLYYVPMPVLSRYA